MCCSCLHIAHLLMHCLISIQVNFQHLILLFMIVILYNYSYRCPGFVLVLVLD